MGDSPADGRSVAETTMGTRGCSSRARGRALIALLGVGVMANVSPLAQGGLDEAFGLAVGARRVRAGEAVLDASWRQAAEPVGAIAAAVVGEQGADGDAVLGVEGDGVLQEGDGGFGLLVGQQLEKARRE